MAKKETKPSITLPTWIQQRPDRALGLLLFFLAFLLFANTLSHDYAWDDTIVITENSRTLKGFAGIPEQWKEHDRVQLEDFSGFRPVTLTSFSIDIGLFGKKPGPAHFMNVLYFALLCWVIYKTLRAIFPHHHRGFAFFVTLLFLVHPMHTEVVANIKSRDEIFVMLFGMLSILSLIHFLREGGWKWAIGTLLLFVLAVLSRQNGALFLFAYPLVGWLLPDIPKAKKWLAAGFLPAGVLLITGTMFLLTGRLPIQFSAVKPAGYFEDLVLGNSLGNKGSLWDQIGSASRLVFLYLRDFFYPAKLTYYSGYNTIPWMDWHYRILAIPFLSVCFSLIYAAIQLFRQRQREIVLGILWFFLFLSPFLHLIFATADTKADRYLFLASLGLCIIIVTLLGTAMKVDWANGNPGKKPEDFFGIAGKGKILAAILIAGSLLLSGVTFTRNKAWKDSYTLYSTDMPKLEECARCHYFLAQEMISRRERSMNPQQDQQAILDHLQKAVAISDSAYYAYTDLANELIRVNQFSKAETYMEKAATFYPGQEDPWYYLGKAEFFQEKFEESAIHFAKARSINPDRAENWDLEGRSLERAKKYPEAEILLQQAIQKFPNEIGLRDALLDVYFYGGKQPEALRKINELVKLDPNNSFWWKKRIGLYEAAAMTDSAAYYFGLAQQAGRL